MHLRVTRFLVYHQRGRAPLDTRVENKLRSQPPWIQHAVIERGECTTRVGGMKSSAIVVSRIINLRMHYNLPRENDPPELMNFTRGILEPMTPVEHEWVTWVRTHGTTRLPVPGSRPEADIQPVLEFPDNSIWQIRNEIAIVLARHNIPVPPPPPAAEEPTAPTAAAPAAAAPVPVPAAPAAAAPTPPTPQAVPAAPAATAPVPPTPQAVPTAPVAPAATAPVPPTPQAVPTAPVSTPMPTPAAPEPTAPDLWQGWKPSTPAVPKPAAPPRPPPAPATSPPPPPPPPRATAKHQMTPQPQHPPTR